MATISSTTAQQLITNVRTLLNQKDRTNSTWTDEDLLNWLNEAVRLYFLEVTLNNEGQFTTQVDLDITANSDLVSLPSDFFEVRAIYKKVTDGYITIPYRNNILEGYSNQGGTSGNTYLPYYYFRGNSLVLRPVPNFAETGGLRMEYIQFPDTMINGGDSMTSQVSIVFKQVIEMYCVYKAKLQESLVSGVQTYKVAQDNLDIVYKLFKDTVALRSKSPQFVVPFNPETEGF